MTTVAILAPPAGLGATPEQLARAERAAWQQMMLIARGHAVDSLEVRCAAELVGSALASDPMEFELAADPGETADDAGPATDAVATAAKATGESDWKKSDSYRRYMRTIMSQAA